MMNNTVESWMREPRLQLEATTLPLEEAPKKLGRPKMTEEQKAAAYASRLQLEPTTLPLEEAPKKLGRPQMTEEQKAAAKAARLVKNPAEMSAQLGGGKIPKIIHQIWIGKNPVPVEWMDTVKEFASEYGYTYKIWNEKSIGELDIDSIPGLRRVYNKFGHELAGKADILRMLALYKYGGIYIDADSVIMKPAKFAAFLEKNRAAVFFGWENLTAARTRKLGKIDPGVRKSQRLVANGLIGTQKKHPFFQKLLNGVADNVAMEAEEKKMAAWKAVGPHYVTRVYNSTRKEFPDVHVYPMKYFYPRHWKGITDPEMHKKVSIPGQSMLFQYGYSTNSFAKIFKARGRGRATRKKSRS